MDTLLCDGEPVYLKLVTALSAHPSGQWVAFGQVEETIETCPLNWTFNILDVERNQLVYTQEGDVWRISWRPNSTEVTFVSSHDIIHMDAISLKELHRYRLGKIPTITSLQWNNAGTQLLSAGWENVLRITDAAGHIIRSIEFPITGIPGSGSGITVARWSPDNLHVMTTDGNVRGAVSIWSPTDDSFALEQQIQLMTDDASHQCFLTAEYNHSGSRLVVSTSDGGVELWDTTNWERLWRRTASERGNALFAWSPDDSQLAVNTHDNRLEIWNPLTGEVMRVIAITALNLEWQKTVGLVYGRQLRYPVDEHNNPVDPGIPVFFVNSK